MENAGQQPEIVIATGLIEGTDGTGAKMSKSKGNYVGLAFEPKDVFGKLMSAADRLLPSYLRALTELLDPEIELLMQLMTERKIHPMGVKTLVTEVPGKDQETVLLTEADATATLGSLLKAHEAVTSQPGARNFLKCGRFLIATR